MHRRVKYWNPERNWAYKPFVREWKKRSLMFWIMPLELAGTVTLLVLFAIAQPDLFRTQLWRVGYVWGFNSDPNIIVYAKANHRPALNVPFVWSEHLTDYNVGISVLSLFVLLAKLIAFIMRVWVPIIGVFFSFAMTVLYVVSVYGQMGPDYYDPEHPSPMAWYIRYGCWPAVNFPNNALSSCRMAVGTYSVTVYQLAVYLACLALAIYSMVPDAAEKEDIKARKAENALRKSQKAADDASSGGDGSPSDKIVFEMVQPNSKQTNAAQYGQYNSYQQQQQYNNQYGPSPFTPRTQAFHALERKLPLRSD